MVQEKYGVQLSTHERGRRGCQRRIRFDPLSPG